MKLLKFPLLVQEQILKSMNYRQIFFLSYASTRTKQMIQMFKFNLIAFHFVFYRHGIKIFFQRNDYERFIICLVLNYQVGAVSSEISDISSGEDRIAWLMIFTRKSDDSDVLLDIQKHIFELFSKSPHFRFTVLIDQIKYYRYVPRVQKLGLLEETVKVEDVEELIRNHSDLKAIIVYKDLVGDISPESNIFQLGVLIIQYPSRPFTDFTDHYKGRFAVFCNSKREDVRLFLEKWLRKECCDHIKHVRLFLAPGVQIGDRFLENISEERWDISTMPEMYPYDEEDAYYAGTHPNVFSCDGVFYTERFDGKVATVGFREDYMMFSVWDKRPW